MGIDVSLTTLVVGAVAVGTNTMVSTFVNWMSARALRAIEREKRKEMVDRECECRTCPLFKECKTRK